jgi:hypothetical protein
MAQTQAVSANETSAMLSLPDAPGFADYGDRAVSSSSSDGISSFLSENDPAAGDEDHGAHSGSRRRFATRNDITIRPGQTAPLLTSHDKVLLGLKESFTLFSVIGWTASAGYSHLTNGIPNYGTDKGAFGERLGATAVRSISENIFGNAILAPLFHDDPRYYKMGSGHNFVKRALYAGTRTLVTRKDDGSARPNYSLLAGNLAGATLTNAYYPTLNHGFSETAKIFGTSVGGSAIGFVVTEFLDDALDFVHLKKLE